VLLKYRQCKAHKNSVIQLQSVFAQEIAIVTAAIADTLTGTVVHTLCSNDGKW